MLNCGDYPAGADRDLRAPYNKKDPEMVKVDVLCSQTLSKTVTIKTDSYKTIIDDETGLEIPDFSETDFSSEFAENTLHTPKELIKMFKKLLMCHLEHIPVSLSEDYCKKLIEECTDWTEDEITFVED